MATVTSSGKPPRWRWTKPLRRGCEDAWLEKLAVLAPGDGLISAKGESGRPKVDVFAVAKRDLTPWLKEYGGRIVPVRPADLHLPHVACGPLRIGRDLVLLPSEDLAAPKGLSPGTRCLRVPANMAFGTGEHATTGMVLRQMASLPVWKERRVSVLDVGTGSGVLSLAARHWGASKVVAFDSDEVAIRIAKENEARNFGDREVDFNLALVEKFRCRRRFDLVVVNLYSDLLMASARRLAGWLKPGATLLASGILNRQEADVGRAFRAAGLRAVSRKRKGRWVMSQWRARHLAG